MSLVAKPLKFGIQQTHHEQELNIYAPRIIAEMVSKTLEACQPDWKTFVLKIEAGDIIRDGVLKARLTVMGEPR